MTFTTSKEYSKSTIKAPRDSTKTCPRLSKASKQHERHCCRIPVVNLNRSYRQGNDSSIYREQTFVCRVDVQLILKRNKKIYTKCKPGKIHKADSAPSNRS